jgi:5-methylcytosine-specific restriction endonuclease McrA
MWMVRQKHLAGEMSIGDSVYLWRSDAGQSGTGGIVAHGTIIDLPKLAGDEDAAQFYTKAVDAKPTLRTKVLLDAVQLHPPKLSRSSLKKDPILSQLPIIKFSNNTNFRVSIEQAQILDELYFRHERQPDPSEEPDANEFPEGRAAYVTHRKRERNPALVRAAKASHLSRFGRLVCQICGFDFGKAYGRVGDGFIEAHHTIPVSELTDNSVSRIENIALVCSNCHRMVHRRRPWLQLHELKLVLSRQNST